jgi:hypothetical protein
MKNILTLLIINISIISGFSQQYFMRTFGTQINDVSSNFIKETDSTLFFFGWRSSSDGILIKTNLFGDTIFTKLYPQFTFTSDIFKISETEFILLGGSEEIIKINNIGNIYWQIISNNYNNRISTKSGTKLNNNQFVIAGSVSVFDHMQFIPDFGMDSIFQQDVLIEKFSNSGTLISRDTINLSIEDESVSQIILKNNILNVVGSSYKFGYPNVFIIRLDTNMNVLMDTVYQYTGIYNAKSIFVDSNSNFIITGDKWINSTQRTNLFVAKYDINGALLWENNYDYTTYEYGSDSGVRIIQNSNGTYSIIGNASNGTSSNHLLLIRVNSDGYTLLNKLIDCTGNKSSNSILELAENRIALFGTTDYNTVGGIDFLYIVCDSLGNFPLNIQNYLLDNSIVLYPNPTVNNVRISSTNDRLIKRIKITDLLGKLEYIDNYKGLNIIDLILNLKTGIYIVEIEDTRNMTTINKLIIK